MKATQEPQCNLEPTVAEVSRHDVDGVTCSSWWYVNVGPSLELIYGRPKSWLRKRKKPSSLRNNINTSAKSRLVMQPLMFQYDDLSSINLYYSLQWPFFWFFNIQLVVPPAWNNARLDAHLIPLQMNSQESFFPPTHLNFGNRMMSSIHNGGVYSFIYALEYGRPNIVILSENLSIKSMANETMDSTLKGHMVICD